MASRTPDGRASGAVNESSLTTSAANIIQVDCASASTKVGITKGHCICWHRQMLYCQQHSLKFSYNFLRFLFIQCKYVRTSVWPWVEYPSCRQTTVASVLLHKSSHTVPHTLFIQISTLPSFGMLPPASRNSPVVHGPAINVQHWFMQHVAKPIRSQYINTFTLYASISRVKTVMG